MTSRIRFVPLESHPHDDQINSLWIHHDIDNVPRFARLPCAHNRAIALECPIFAMDLYRIDRSRLRGLHQDNPSSPAIPPLLAPTKQPGFQPHSLGRNGGNHLLSADKTSRLSDRPPDTKVSSFHDSDSDTCSYKSHMLRSNDPCNPIGN